MTTIATITHYVNGVHIVLTHQRANQSYLAESFVNGMIKNIQMTVVLKDVGEIVKRPNSDSAEALNPIEKRLGEE